MNGRGGKFDPKRVKELEHGVVAWFCARRKRFVQTLTTQTGILGQLRHATRTSDVSYRA